jgi:hypothetical protein
VKWKVGKLWGREGRHRVLFDVWTPLLGVLSEEHPKVKREMLLVSEVYR